MVHDSETKREGGRGRGGEGIEPKRAPFKVGQKLAQIWPRKTGRDSELDPCLAWVQREQKAATKGARFGAHFTQTYGFSASKLGSFSATSLTTLGKRLSQLYRGNTTRRGGLNWFHFPPGGTGGHIDSSRETLPG